MKKFYLLATTALAVTFFNAQSLTAVAQNIAPVKSERNPAAILFQQNKTTNSGIVSDELNDGSFVMCADDFKLTENAKVEKISFVGFQSAQNLATLMNGVNMYIYADNGASPAGIPGDNAPYLLKVDVAENSPAYTLDNPQGSSYIFTVDVVAASGAPLELAANTNYWVTFAPKVDLPVYDGDNRWNWFVGDIANQKAKLVDPSNAFGADAFLWTNISALTGEAVFDGLAFTIEGENSLGTTEIYSTIKDVTVAQDAQNLFIYAKNDKVKSAEIFSTDGKKVLTGESSTLDIAKLPKGVYIVNVTTTSGKVKSTKFIKR